MPAVDEVTIYTPPDVPCHPEASGLTGVRHQVLQPGEQPGRDRPGVWVVDASSLGDTAEAISAAICDIETSDTLLLVLISNVEQTHLTDEADERVFAHLNPNAPEHLQAKIVRRAVGDVRMAVEHGRLAASLKARDQQLQELNRIGLALSAERDVDQLLAEILQKARHITQADAGSLYLVEPDEQGGERLRFKLSQNDSFDLDYNEFTIPLNRGSLAGYTAVTGETLRLPDVYEIPDDVDYSFSRSWDEQAGYRTTSMLVVAMMNNKGEIRGVLQLINRKRDGELKLSTPDSFHQNVTEFDEQCEELVGSLASQAAVALENRLLLQNIQNIFEGFLMGWVKAVEDRDPATAGHSHRVTALTLALAREVNRCDRGPFADTFFTEAQLEELRYAGLLHDIGKIYVRAEVFLKAKKLYTHHLKLIQERFDFVKRTVEAEYNKRKLEVMIEAPQGGFARRFDEIDQEYAKQLEELDDYFQTILMANEPTVLDEDRFERLSQIAGDTYRDIYGNAQHLLQPDELKMLAIRRGNLDESERREIESHVAWSYRILARIPWSDELKEIPAIAGAHHEKLNGTGYPNGLHDDQISARARMMTIADIYDALTAADRPYKRAQSTESALKILGYERNDGHIDGDLLELFCERQVWRVAHLDGVEQLVNRLVYEDIL